MTYKKLLEKLQQLPAEQLEQDVTIGWVKDDDTSEYFRVESFGAIRPDDDDVLEAGHQILYVYESA